MSRLTIDITDQQHRSLKALAALHGQSIKQYAVERLFPDPVDSGDDWNALKKLLTQRIEAGLAGGTSTSSIDAIVEQELGRNEDV